MAVGASGQHRVVKFLQMIFFKAAGVAAISIDRHEVSQSAKQGFRLYPNGNARFGIAMREIGVIRMISRYYLPDQSENT